MRDQRHLQLRDLIITLFVGLAIYVAWVVRSTLLLIYVGLIFAVVFSPAVTWVQQRRIGKWHPSRGAAILILLVCVLAAISIFIFVALPPISRDSQALATQLPGTVSKLREKLQALPFGSSFAARVNTQSLENALRSLATTALSVFRGITGGLMALLTIGLLTAYFILDGQRAFQWAMSLAPQSERARLSATLLRAKDRVERWLIGQMALMAILASLTAIVLGILGVRYFYAIAVFAGLANFIPILGPIATVILAGAMAAIDSWGKLLGVVLFYFAYQQLENAYLTPRIMRSTVDLPGIAVIIALALGGALAGILGAIVAVPTAALVGTVINEYLESREHEPLDVQVES
jgi:predicted PurR-regulated permease PerM